MFKARFREDKPKFDPCLKLILTGAPHPPLDTCSLQDKWCWQSVAQVYWFFNQILWLDALSSIHFKICDDASNPSVKRKYRFYFHIEKNKKNNINYFIWWTKYLYLVIVKMSNPLKVLYTDFIWKATTLNT